MVRTALHASEPTGPQDIADLVGQHTALRLGGEGQLWGICPFCRSMAFRVRAVHGTFHCFGCGEGGDARRFTVKIGHRS